MFCYMSDHAHIGNIALVAFRLRKDSGAAQQDCDPRCGDYPS